MTHSDGTPLALHAGPALTPGSDSGLSHWMQVNRYAARSTSSDDPSINELRDYWRAVRVYQWRILAFAALVTVLATAVVFSMRPTYRSTALVMIDSDKPKLLGAEDVYSGANASREYFQTQAETLKSRTIADHIIDRYALADQKEFDPNSLYSRTLRWLASEPIDDPRSLRSAVVRQFTAKLNVDPIRQSQLIKVSFDSWNPDLAAQVANAVVQEFIAAEIGQRIALQRAEGSALAERIGELKARVDQAERAAQAYRERQNLVNVTSTVQGSRGRQLDDLTRRLVDARVQRSEAEDAHQQVRAAASRGSGLESVPIIAKDVSVQSAREGLTLAERRVAEAASRYGEGHPSLLSANSEREAARLALDKAIGTVVQTTAKSYASTRAIESSISEEIRLTQSQMQDISRKEIELGALDAEAQAARQIYQTFLSRSSESQATNDIRAASARVIEVAQPSVRPQKPNKLLIIALSAVGSLVIGVLAAILVRRFSSGIVNGRQAVDKLDRPVIASIPRLDSRHQPVHAVLNAPHTEYAEAIRTAATRLLLSHRRAASRVHVVTSSVAGEGKSTVSANLALCLSRSSRVLLIEADMRRPSIARSFGLESSLRGLSEFIDGSATLDQTLVVHQSTGLHLLLCPRAVPNPLDLLVCDAFADKLSALRDSYDHIIIDTPPVQMVSDPVAVASLADAVLYVVKAESTPASAVLNGTQRLDESGVASVEVIINQVDPRRAAYYGEYGTYPSQYQYV